MDRGKKIVLLAHCLLNINTKVEGLACAQAGCIKLVTELMQRGYGLMQLPCPEQYVCGCRRWGQVKEQLAHPHYRESCCKLLKPLVRQIEDFAANGYRIAGVIGIDGSPTCGVNFTCSGNWGGELAGSTRLSQKLDSLCYISEAGVMMEELQKMLAAAHLRVPFFAVRDEEQEDSIRKLVTSIEANPF